MPGENGSLHRGHRDFNFLWYQKLPPSSALYQAALTDRSGHRHRSTLPKGKMDPAVWTHQLEAKDHMLPAFQEICSKVKEPFISTINDCAAPRARYLDSKVLLVRPHTGISFDTSAFQALELKRAVSGQITFDEWEKRVLRNNRKSELFAVAYGRYLMYGALKPSFWLSLLRYVLLLVSVSFGRGFFRT